MIYHILRMINTKQDLKYYLLEDSKRFNHNKPKLKDWLLKNEKWYIYHYIYHLRYIEYYINTQNKGLRFLYHWIKYKHLGFKLNCTIYPNTVGPGFKIYHKGNFTFIKRSCIIGKNCTMLTGVVFGNKYEKEDQAPVIVGDNCYFGLDVKIFGSVKIGNNVTIGANSVVTKDIPDNAIVGGIPAKVIRFQNETES